MALTQGPSALRSRALRIIAYETREIPYTDYYVTWSSASAHRLLCDLKFCIYASTHGIFFGLKFRLRTRNILRLKVPQFRFRIQNSVWLGSSKMAQFRFCTRKILWLGSYAIPLPYNKLVRLEVSQFRFHTRALTFKSRNSASAQRISCDLKFRFRTRNILCLEVQQFCFRTQNNLWLEVPQFSTIYCDLNFRSSASAKKKRRHLKFRTSASAREHNFSLENPLSFNHPPIS